MSIYASIAPLTWESDFFALPSAKLRWGGEQPLTLEQLNQWSLVQARVPSHDYQQLDSLNQLGFRWVEGEAELTLAITHTERQSGIGIARPEQLTALNALASHAFSQSRFRQPWFSAEQNQQFYARWVENALLGTFDDQCLVATDEARQVCGFVTLKQLSEEARIGLLAVAPSAQGAGVGARLLLAAADWGRAKGLKRLLITTQLSNLSAMRLYLRHGARLENTAYWLYRTPDDSI